MNDGKRGTAFQTIVCFYKFGPMKRNLILPIVLLSLLAFVQQGYAFEQAKMDSTGLPGDNFNLQNALHLFKNSSSPEEFEKKLNTASTNVNNMDLNSDGKIDYIRVVDKGRGNAHALIMQVPVTKKESQDIAVIELEKTGDTTAILQIVGDPDIYGEQVIVEPTGAMTANSGNKGGSEMLDAGVVVVNVWAWPSVRYLYVPAYTPYISPYYYNYYLVWWSPWAPVPYAVYYPYQYRYYNSYLVVKTHRVTSAHRVYSPYRTTSVSVTHRHPTAVGNYRVTKTNTVVKGPRGNVTQVKKQTVRTPRGSATRTQVRRRN